jgi:hypothetical protein
MSNDNKFPHRPQQHTPGAVDTTKPKLIGAREAQLGLLRYALREEDAGAWLKRNVDEPDFLDPQAQAIARALLTVWEAGLPVNGVTVGQYLQEQKETDAFNVLYSEVLPTPEIEPNFQDCLHTVLNHKKTRGPAANPFRLVGLREIFERPRLEWLIQGVLLEVGSSALTGGYGTFKSFVVLDMALSIAAGRSWQGREVKQGRVVYVVAEGAYTTADRVKAWMIRHQVEMPEDFKVIEVPAQIGDPVVCAQFIEAIREFNPSLIVLDTLAKCNVGADENSTAEMGLFTHGMETVAREASSHVLAVHHNNKQGTARGSNSLPSNVDTHITVKASPGRIAVLECDKHKGAPFEPIALVGRIVDLGEQDEYGTPVTSLVFEATDAPPMQPSAPVSKSEATRTQVLEVLRTKFPNGATSGEWKSACAEVGISRTRFFGYRAELIDREEVTQEGQLFRSSPKSPKSPKPDELDSAKESQKSHTALAVGLLGLTRTTSEPYHANGVERGVL